MSYPASRTAQMKKRVISADFQFISDKKAGKREVRLRVSRITNSFQGYSESFEGHISAECLLAEFQELATAWIARRICAALKSRQAVAVAQSAHDHTGGIG
jgi:hypothetical protein